MPRKPIQCGKAAAGIDLRDRPEEQGQTDREMAVFLLFVVDN